MGIVVVKEKKSRILYNQRKKNQNKIQDGELQEEEKERCKLIISTVEYIFVIDHSRIISINMVIM